MQTQGWARRGRWEGRVPAGRQENRSARYFVFYYFALDHLSCKEILKNEN